MDRLGFCELAESSLPFTGSSGRSYVLLFYNYAVMSTTYNTGNMLKEKYICCTDQGSLIIILNPEIHVGGEK